MGVPPGFAACCVAYPGVNIRKDVENTWGNPGKMINGGFFTSNCEFTVSFHEVTGGYKVGPPR